MHLVVTSRGTNDRQAMEMINIPLLVEGSISHQIQINRTRHRQILTSHAQNHQKIIYLMTKSAACVQAHSKAGVPHSLLLTTCDSLAPHLIKFASSHRRKTVDNKHWGAPRTDTTYYTRRTLNTLVLAGTQILVTTLALSLRRQLTVLIFISSWLWRLVWLRKIHSRRRAVLRADWASRSLSTARLTWACAFSIIPYSTISPEHNGMQEAMHKRLINKPAEIFSM